MKGIKLLAMTFLIMATITTIVVLSAKEQRTSTLMSRTGCCTITTTKHTSGDYYIVYSDNLENITAVEIEKTPQDADYMINTFQEYCMEHHPINQNY